MKASQFKARLELVRLPKAHAGCADRRLVPIQQLGMHSGLMFLVRCLPWGRRSCADGQPVPATENGERIRQAKFEPGQPKADAVACPPGGANGHGARGGVGLRGRRAHQLPGKGSTESLRCWQELGILRELPRRAHLCDTLRHLIRPLLLGQFVVPQCPDQLPLQLRRGLIRRELPIVSSERAWLLEQARVEQEIPERRFGVSDLAARQTATQLPDGDRQVAPVLERVAGPAGGGRLVGIDPGAEHLYRPAQLVKAHLVVIRLVHGGPQLFERVRQFPRR
mmetsp:Transcript_125751/g.363784  ORF Transcript_125751/g.363784 Transcript_125751/m.363784 type:complete len:280 (+) Transcript_125751:1016-1855(+)